MKAAIAGVFALTLSFGALADNEYWTLVERVAVMLRAYQCETDPEHCGTLDPRSPLAQRIVNKMSEVERRELLQRISEFSSKSRETSAERDSLLQNLWRLASN